MKIYTRGGDKGITSMLGGTRVPKNHPRLEACGSVDELMSWIGLLRDQQAISSKTGVLLWIQDRLMVASAVLAREDAAALKVSLLQSGDVKRLENEIDLMEKELPVLRSFIIPGGHTASSFCHIARSVCRRVERSLVPIITGEADLELVLAFMNRLSDFLFVLARYVIRVSGLGEIKWNT